MLVEQHQPLHKLHQHEEPCATARAMVRSSSSSFDVSTTASCMTEVVPTVAVAPEANDKKSTRRVSFYTNPEGGKLKVGVYRYESSAEDRAAMYSSQSDVERIQDACRRVVMIYRSRSDYMASLDMLYSNPLQGEEQQDDDAGDNNNNKKKYNVNSEESALRLVSRCSSRGLERQIYKSIKSVRRSTIQRILELQALHHHLHPGRSRDSDDYDDDLAQKLSSLSMQASARDKFFALKLAIGDYKEAKRVYDERPSGTSPVDFSSINSSDNMMLDRSDHSFDSFSSRKLTHKHLSESL